jgi:hypothetical protein
MSQRGWRVGFPSLTVQPSGIFYKLLSIPFVVYEMRSFFDNLIYFMPPKII